jgi:CRP/FNR family cyclic AMP-dependent transcriptional regulator
MRTQADLVDQLFNSSEKRLARILLLMAEFGQPGEPETSSNSIARGTHSRCYAQGGQDEQNGTEF